MKSGALAEWRFFEVSSYVWPKPMFFPKFQRPADWSDHPSSATEDHLRDKRKAAKLPKHGRKRKRAQTLANKDCQRWRSKWTTFNSMLEFRNVGKNRNACKTIGGFTHLMRTWLKQQIARKNGESLNKQRGIRLAEAAEMVIKLAGYPGWSRMVSPDRRKTTASHSWEFVCGHGHAQTLASV